MYPVGICVFVVSSNKNYKKKICIQINQQTELNEEFQFDFENEREAENKLVLNELFNKLNIINLNCTYFCELN